MPFFPPLVVKGNLRISSNVSIYLLNRKKVGSALENRSIILLMVCFARYIKDISGRGPSSSCSFWRLDVRQYQSTKGNKSGTFFYIFCFSLQGYIFWPLKCKYNLEWMIFISIKAETHFLLAGTMRRLKVIIHLETQVLIFISMM